MARLLVVVEGETEEAFVNEVLAPHLHGKGFDGVAARILGNARLRNRRGGVRPWSGVRSELVRHLRSDRGVFVSTMVDFYGLPRSGKRAWPGTNSPRPERIEEEMANDIGRALGGSSSSGRFFPFVVMHEFEGLLFSDCAGFARAIGKPELEPELWAIRRSFDTPEDINDSPETHPAARVTRIFNGYQKPLHGARAAREVTLTRIGQECPHFRDWISRLELAVTR